MTRAETTALIICILGIILMMGFAIVKFEEMPSMSVMPEPSQIMSQEFQCQIWNKYAFWPEFGSCE